MDTSYRILWMQTSLPPSEAPSNWWGFRLFDHGPIEAMSAAWAGVDFQLAHLSGRIAARNREIPALSSHQPLQSVAGKDGALRRISPKPRTAKQSV